MRVTDDIWRLIGQLCYQGQTKIQLGLILQQWRQVE